MARGILGGKFSESNAAAGALVSAQGFVTKRLERFKEFPPRAKSASFSIDRVVKAMLPKSRGGINCC